jgi:hypothetical protein
MNKYEAIEAILCELERAEQKHDWTGYDVVHMAAKLSGEAGEALREANKLHEGEGDLSAYQMEVVQAGAMAVRCLINQPK